MKNFKLSIVAVLISCALFAVSPAKADPQATDQQANNGQDVKNKGGDSNGEQLPINNQVWFLIIAGAVIGCKVIIDKSKAARA